MSMAIAVPNSTPRRAESSLLTRRFQPAGMVWNRASLETRTTWRLWIPHRVATEFVDFCAAYPASEDFITDLGSRTDSLPELQRFAWRLRNQLLFGEGVVWLRGLASIRHADGTLLSPIERKRFYAELGGLLGKPMTSYGVLYPVRDRGVDYMSSAHPVSMTGAETGFHTDSSHIDVEPDLVGLLCETPSLSGGESLISNALHVYRQMRLQDPDLLEILKRPFIRDVVTPGLERTEANLLRNRFPIFTECNRPGGLNFRYMRYWIERGQESAGQPLDASARAALDALDLRLAAPENVVSFRLDKGDILWLNNRTVAHNRTAYQDSEDQIRQLQRMWISTPAIR